MEAIAAFLSSKYYFSSKTTEVRNYNMFISFVTHLPFLILNTYFVYIKNTLRSRLP